MRISAGDVIELRNTRGDYRITAVDWKNRTVDVLPVRGRRDRSTTIPFANILGIVRLHEEECTA